MTGGEPAWQIFAVHGRLSRPDLDRHRLRGAATARTSFECGAGQNRRPLVGSERQFTFGEWCLRKGQSAAADGGGRDGLHEGRRQR